MSDDFVIEFIDHMLKKIPANEKEAKAQDFLRRIVPLEYQPVKDETPQ